MNVVLYARYSSSKQTEQSIEGQVHVCEKYCKQNNMTIIHKYIDRATSASHNIEKRESFLQMIKDAENGNFEAVVVYKLDRFARNRYDSANYKLKLKKCGVQLISATEAISNNPEGIILESVLEGMAEFYSAELSQKIKRGINESASKHKYLGGVIPLGYKIVDGYYQIDEETAPIVREAFTLYDEGKSGLDMVRILNAKGYKTTKGNKFNKNSFWRMLRNKKYIGCYEFKGVVTEDAIPAIIDKDLFERVNKKLRDIDVHSEGGKKHTVIPYLLSGKIICGSCNYVYAGKRAKGGAYSYYVCRGRTANANECTAPNIRTDILDKLVLNDTKELLTDENIKEISKAAVKANKEDIELHTNLKGLKEELTKTDKALGNLLKMAELGDTPDIILDRIKELSKEKRSLISQIRAESQQIYELDEYQIEFFLHQFKNGDINDPLFAQTLVNMLVNKIVIYHDENNDTAEITYNLSTLSKRTYPVGDKSLFANNTQSSTSQSCWRTDKYTLDYKNLTVISYIRLK